MSQKGHKRRPGRSVRQVRFFPESGLFGASKAVRATSGLMHRSRPASFDHRIGPGEQGWRHLDA
jgi:hypothetical protein